jgi:thiamine-phosphate pyrophosphorylase
LQPAPDFILMYVTDRHALGGVSQLNDAIDRAIAAGVDWIQIREKDLETRALVELTQTASSAQIKACANKIVGVILNDRLDVALAAGAAGVHLGEASLPVRSVADWRRTSGRTDFLIGASCHSVERAMARAILFLGRFLRHHPKRPSAHHTESIDCRKCVRRLKFR